jgi:hypothetical protein
MDETPAVGLDEPFASSAPRRGGARRPPFQRRRTVAVTTLRIKGSLVGYLRTGVLREMAATLQVLEVEVTQREIDPTVYGRALARFDETRALLDVIGLTTLDGDHDMELHIGSWRGLVLKVLKTQYSIERSRLEDAAVDGVRLATRDVPALGELVAELRDKPLPPHRQPILRWRKRQRGW